MEWGRCGVTDPSAGTPPSFLHLKSRLTVGPAQAHTHERAYGNGQQYRVTLCFQLLSVHCGADTTYSTAAIPELQPMELFTVLGATTRFDSM